MENLKDKMLEAIFVKTGGRLENVRIAQICAQIAEEELNKKLTLQMTEAHTIKSVSRKKIKQVILLTSHIYNDKDDVWGDDTPLGKMENLINEAEKILG